MDPKAEAIYEGMYLEATTGLLRHAPETCTSFRAERLHEPCEGSIGPTPLGPMCQKHTERLQQVLTNITEHELKEK